MGSNKCELYVLTTDLTDGTKLEGSYQEVDIISNEKYEFWENTYN